MYIVSLPFSHVHLATMEAFKAVGSAYMYIYMYKPLRLCIHTCTMYKPFLSHCGYVYGIHACFFLNVCSFNVFLMYALSLSLLVRCARDFPCIYIVLVSYMYLQFEPDYWAGTLSTECRFTLAYVT